jgi:hypothetical protein
MKAIREGPLGVPLMGALAKDILYVQYENEYFSMEFTVLFY